MEIIIDTDYYYEYYNALQMLYLWFNYIGILQMES